MQCTRLNKPRCKMLQGALPIIWSGYRRVMELAANFPGLHIASNSNDVQIVLALEREEVAAFLREELELVVHLFSFSPSPPASFSPQRHRHRHVSTSRTFAIVFSIPWLAKSPTRGCRHEPCKARPRRFPAGSCSRTYLSSRRASSSARRLPSPSKRNASPRIQAAVSLCTAT